MHVRLGKFLGECSGLVVLDQDFGDRPVECVLPVDRPFPALHSWVWGGGVEASGDEEHAQAVVVGVAVASGGRRPISMIPLMASVGPLMAPAVSK